MKYLQISGFRIWASLGAIFCLTPLSLIIWHIEQIVLKPFKLWYKTNFFISFHGAIFLYFIGHWIFFGSLLISIILSMILPVSIQCVSFHEKFINWGQQTCIYFSLVSASSDHSHFSLNVCTSLTVSVPVFFPIIFLTVSYWLSLFP